MIAAFDRTRPHVVMSTTHYTSREGVTLVMQVVQYFTIYGEPFFGYELGQLSTGEWPGIKTIGHFDEAKCFAFGRRELERMAGP